MPDKHRSHGTVRLPRGASLGRQRERLARLQQQFESVERRIFRIESGLELPETLSLTALRLYRSGLQEDIARLRNQLGLPARQSIRLSLV